MRLRFCLFAICLGLLPVLAAGWQDPPRKDKDGPPREVGQGPGGGRMQFGFGGPGQPQRKLVPQFDKDGDGKLNREERQAARAFLKTEGGGRRGPRGPGGFGPGGMVVGPLLQALDSDKDKKVSKEELTAGLRMFFTTADKDNKGAIGEAEVAAAIDRIFPRAQGGPGGGPPDRAGRPDKAGQARDKTSQPPEKGPPDKMGGPGMGFRFMRPGTVLAGEVLKRADKDKNGKITLDELTAAASVLFTEVDKDKDGQLDNSELSAAAGQLFPTATFGPGGLRENQGPAKPGPQVAKTDVKSYPDAAFYEPNVLRTIFLDFEDKDWEPEMADFYHTDVELPATMTIEGKQYPNVGVHFRGASSYFAVREGYKRSLNVSLDFSDSKQRIQGYKTLNLLNSHEDPTFLSTVLFSHMARQYLPAPKANLVKVVINGESWGLYASVQQFDKHFLAENFKSTKGARWKVKGSPGGGGGLDYIGDKIDDYKRRYELKTEDKEKDWKALIELCRVLSKTPADELEAKLKPILDIDGALWFLALDIALINNDGYWIRASDYSLYRDEKGKFHVIPHDMNEAFGPPGGPGFGFGPGGPGGGRGGATKDGPPGKDAGRPRGVDLDPLYGLEDARKPLRSKLLAVPKFREQYLKNLHTIAEQSLSWDKLGPVVKQFRALIENEVEADTRKLYSLADFQARTGETPVRLGMSLKAFADQRSKYLLNYEPKKASR